MSDQATKEGYYIALNMLTLRIQKQIDYLHHAHENETRDDLKLRLAMRKIALMGVNREIKKLKEKVK